MMTPQLARIALCGFACLAAGVAANALYFQQRGVARVSFERSSQPTNAGKSTLQPTAWSPSKPAGKTDARRLGPFEANTLKLENPPEPGAVDGRPETIRAVQRELKNRGYGPIMVDGVPGLATRAAIMAFETDEKLPLTAIANELLLKYILLGPGASIEPPSSAEPGPRAQEVIKAVQNWLLTLGFQAGSAEGLMTREMEAAIRAFEVSQGLAPRGRVTADLVKRLADTVPLKAPVR